MCQWDLGIFFPVLINAKLELEWPENKYGTDT